MDSGRVRGAASVVTVLTVLAVDASSSLATQPMFSGGDAYERFMGRWSRELAPLLVAFAGVRDGDAVLDVGSGTGALVAAVAATNPSSRMVGIDPAASYVAFAQTRHGGGRITF